MSDLPVCHEIPEVCDDEDCDNKATKYVVADTSGVNIGLRGLQYSVRTSTYFLCEEHAQEGMSILTSPESGKK